MTESSLAPELRSAFFAVLEKLVNLPLANAPRAQESLLELNGRILKIKAEDLKQEVYLKSGASKLEMHGNYAAVPDVTLAAGSVYLIKLILNQDSEVLFSPEIKISGDIETAREYQRLFANIHKDTEDMLAGFVGDTAAHGIGSLVKDFTAWAFDSKARFIDMTADFVKYEAKLVPDSSELADFIKGVDNLRSRFDILEARINRIG